MQQSDSVITLCIQDAIEIQSHMSTDGRHCLFMATIVQ